MRKSGSQRGHYERRPSRKRNLFLKAYEDIKQKIIYFDLKPGDRIFENEIARNLGMSRTPVRESLLVLENEGLVERDSRSGFIVRRLSREEVEEYFLIRKILESYAVPLIVNRITKEELQALEANLREAEIFVENNDLKNIIRCETEFHHILYQSAKSDVFLRTISALIDKFHWIRAIALATPGGSKKSLNDHKKIYQALCKRDIKELRKLMQLHLRHAKDYAFRQGVFL